MKQIFYLIIFLYSMSSSGQIIRNDFKFKGYDSLVIQTFDDYTYEIEFGGGERPIFTVVKGQATMSSEDAKEFNRRLRRKDSYGQNQEIPTVFDFKLLYYKNGKMKEEVSVSLWTNYLYTSFPLRVQRQLNFPCSGETRSGCSECGISLEFKKYMLYLLKKYNSPIG